MPSPAPKNQPIKIACSLPDPTASTSSIRAPRHLPIAHRGGLYITRLVLSLSPYDPLPSSQGRSQDLDTWEAKQS